jgi:hypothetical protein
LFREDFVELHDTRMRTPPPSKVPKVGPKPKERWFSKKYTGPPGAAAGLFTPSDSEGNSPEGTGDA